jgi:UDP-GlcNAc:undecaprenyl-phosphate GlcNAc-1-phosphate transferase
MIVATLTAFCFTFIAIKVFKPIVIDVGLVDKPNARKHHNLQVPLIGRISMLATVFADSIIWLPNSLELRMYLVASAMPVVCLSA